MPTQRFASTLVLVTLVLTKIVAGGEPITPMHLVGHEDIALLDRVQDLIDDWDPRKLVNPVFETVEVQLPDGCRVLRKVLKRPDLAEFIADVEAAEALGKAFFWDMQAGSDYRRLADGTTYVGTACASCHYRNGTDARSRHAMRIPYVAWDQYPIDEINHGLEFGEQQLPFDVKATAVFEANFQQPSPYGKLSLTVGSAGVEPRLYKGNQPLPEQDPGGAWEFEMSTPRTVEDYQDYPRGHRPQWSMFLDGQINSGQRFRQITPRNSPSIVNSGFADRLFHDGRAESTFNGFSIFGDRDQRPVLWRGVPIPGSEFYGRPVQVHVAIPKAALASQAVGPILSDVEMSSLGRTFPNVACKLLGARILPHQQVEETDSVLGQWKKRGWVGNPKSERTYRDLIRKAFRREWWDAGKNLAGNPYEVPLTLMIEHETPAKLLAKDIPTGEMMAANFPLYWGLSIMIYESSLVSNRSPFDGMMQGNSTLVEERWQEVKGKLQPIRLDRALANQVPAPEHKTGSAVFQHGFRIFLNRGCIECHSGPLFSEVYERIPEFDTFPIHEQLETILLPNSRSEAIALQRSSFHHQTLSSIVQQLLGLPASLTSQQAWQLARLLDAQREFARGDVGQLQLLVEAKLSPVGGTALGKPIADLLLLFEKEAPKKFGNRRFFTEDERVALAEQLVDPVLVESMPIPPRHVQFRPPLPIQGPLATTNYAFYDLGFYAIGSGPPRYDRGIGGWDSTNLADAVFELVARELDSESIPQSESAALKEALTEWRNAKGPYQYQNTDIQTKLNTRLQQAAQRLMADGANPATPGASNRFRSSSQYEGLTLEATETHRGRDCHEGPLTPADESEKRQPMLEDRSWERDFLPGGRRRSDLIFFSRARTLVSDEEPWGFRKPFLHDKELAFWGAFKTPTLRNVELTGPFMHNGGLESLFDVIDMYDEGGRIGPNHNNNPDHHPEIVELDLTENDKKALWFFLICLTDERVRKEQAPFDHPSLSLVHGYDAAWNERIRPVDAIGAKGWINQAQIPPAFPHRQ